jgi:hypothetical protein
MTHGRGIGDACQYSVGVGRMNNDMPAIPAVQAIEEGRCRSHNIRGRQRLFAHVMPQLPGHCLGHPAGFVLNRIGHEQSSDATKRRECPPRAKAISST